MTIPWKPEAGLLIEANALYVLNMKSQGSITWSDLTGKTGSPQFPDGYSAFVYAWGWCMLKLCGSQACSLQLCPHPHFLHLLPHQVILFLTPMTWPV